MAGISLMVGKVINQIMGVLTDLILQTAVQE